MLQAIIIKDVNSIKYWRASRKFLHRKELKSKGQIGWKVEGIKSWKHQFWRIKQHHVPVEILCDMNMNPHTLHLIRSSCTHTPWVVHEFQTMLFASGEFRILKVELELRRCLTWKGFGLGFLTSYSPPKMTLRWLMNMSQDYVTRLGFLSKWRIKKV